MARPQTRQQLAEYCLRSLGGGVLEVNISDEQLEDRIDEAIQYYQEFHSDAVVRNFYKHQVTQQDMDNKFITLPEQFLFVLRVLPLNAQTGGREMFSVEYQMMMADFMGLRNGTMNMLDYEMTKQHMALMAMEIGGLSQQVNFTRHMNRLSIEIDWKAKLSIGDYIIVEGFATIDPDEYVSIYNDMMLKKHLTALLKKMWATNLIKFEGVQLPGGVTMNGGKMYDDAIAEITKIEDEYQDRYAFPADFYIG